MLKSCRCLCEVFVDALKVPTTVVVSHVPTSVVVSHALPLSSTLTEGKTNLSFDGNRASWPSFWKELRSSCDGMGNQYRNRYGSILLSR